MGFQELIQAIGEQAVRQREAILSQAEEEARAIVRQAEARLPDLLRGARTRAEAGAREDALRILSLARLEARRAVRAARHRVVEHVVHLLGEQLAGLSSTMEYRAVLEALLAECLAEAAGPVTVRCRREDRAIVEEFARRQRLVVSIEEASLPLGGVETTSGPDGRIVCRNGLDDRLESARPLLLQEAGRLLFGRSGGGSGA
jgi:vacuolar-type H+-ATPase subunit E/Vma4